MCARGLGPVAELRGWWCGGYEEREEREVRAGLEAERERVEREADDAMEGDLQRLHDAQVLFEDLRKRGVEGTLKRVKHCPGCGVATEKVSGCDHIQCSLCGVHWCYFCAGAFGEYVV